MKKLFSSMLCIMACIAMLNAKTIFVTPTGSNASTGGPSGLSWSEAVGLSRAGTLATAGDVVYVMGGTFNYSKSTPTAGGAFGTSAGVGYYGSFAGTESAPPERATSDVDGNGIVDPWEFTNQTILNFTLTNSSAGFITSNASTTATNINGFKLTGTNTASTFSPSTVATQTLRIGKNIIFENNIISNWVVTSTLDGTNLQTPFFSIYDGGINNAKINNCLFENNNISYTASSALSADNSFFPFICLTNAAATCTTGNVMSNCVIRNNKVTIDYSAASSTSATNMRGLIIAVKAPSISAANPPADLSSTLQNSIIHNNEVNFIPKPGVIDTCYGAVVYTYNQTTAASDYILNCTIANNKTTKCGGAGLKIGMDINAPHEKPNHTIMNNVLFNNFNNSTINNIEANFPIPETSTTTVANNICNGGATNIANVGFLQSNNLFNLSNDNANATTGANFFRPTTAIGITADGSAEKSNWRIKANSYLKGKGMQSNNSADKAGFTFADMPSVGAYEYDVSSIGTASVSPSTLTGFSYEYGSGSSIEQSFTITGTGLSSVITLTAPSDYEISTSTGETFSATSPISINPSSGSVNSTIYVRLKSGLAVATYNTENISIASNDFATKNVVCSGSVVHTVVATVSPSTLTGFSYALGSGPSSEQSFTITGTGLSSAITLTAPTHYEISNGTGGAFSATSPITINPSSGSVNSTIYVRLKSGLAVSTYNTENISIASNDFATKNVACSGSVVNIVHAIYVTPTGSNATGGGLSWSDPVGLTRAGTLATSGYVVYVMGGIYNLTKTAPTAAGAFTTTAGVSYYGSFAGTESSPSERETSDVDGNGIVEPWEFTNQSILSFTLTGSAGGFTTSNASTIVSSVNGFKFTGTNTASDFSTSNVRVTMRISKNIRFENNSVADWTVTGAFSTTPLVAPFFEVVSGNGNAVVHNCLFANNTITYTSTQATSSFFHPFIALGNATSINRTVMSNCVVRNNRVTMDYSGSSLTDPLNRESVSQRGLIVSILSPAATFPTTLKNSIIHNNEVSFIPNVDLDRCYGAPVYVYNSANNLVSDSIINNTIANNKTTKCGSAGIKFGMDLAGAAAPNHIIMNNVMYNNKNNGSISNFEANLAVPTSIDYTMIKNNICNGGVMVIANNIENVVDNLFDLSDENAGTNGAFFNRPTTTVGYVADGTVELSRWVIASNSYLKGKGIATLNTTDKAGRAFAATPSVGAYEYDASFYTGNIINRLKNNWLNIDGRNINSSIQGSMEVYNIVGRLVATSKSESTITLNNGGIYIVKINSTNVNKVQKIFVK